MTVTSATRAGQPSNVPAAGVPSSRKRRYSHSREERAVRVPARPPGAERVLQQEPDHVVLGEELGHRRQVGAADLVAALVDLVLALALPELVDPAQGIVGGEQRGRQALEDGLEPAAVLGREGDPVGGVVGPEDAGQHRRGVPGGEDPGVALALLGRELPDVGDRDRRALGVEQQVVLGEEPGEQHPVPLLVRDLLDEQWDAQRPDPAAQGLGALAERGAQAAQLGRQAGRGLGVLDAETGEGGSGRRLGQRPRTRSGAGDRLVEVATELGGEGRHRSDHHCVAGVEVSSDRSAELVEIGVELGLRRG